VNKTGGEVFTQIKFNFKTNTMTKQYKNKKELIISDPSKFPEDFWNYWVNPIVGYYIPSTQSKKYKRKDKTI
tara:strand:+ start:49 stop:264 length:216 start_codon:yes stop_codon:yes gene_type:complete